MNDNQTNGNQATGNAAPQTENAPQPVQRDPTEISALTKYRTERLGSSPKQEAPKQGGDANPDGGRDKLADGREAFIPRERFDEVNQNYQQMKQQLENYQRQSMQGQPQNFQQQAPQTGMLQQQQPAPQWQTNPTGMQQQPQQQQAQAPQRRVRMDDPAYVKEWQRKIANDPVKSLGAFIEDYINDVGAPMLTQLQQQIQSQLAPIQRAHVANQLNTYATTRQQADPSFTQVRPVFEQLVHQAAQRGYDVQNPTVLSHLEFSARQQQGLGMPTYGTPHAAPQVPFTESPGSGNQGFNQRANQPSLTREQMEFAKRFGMEPAEYADSLKLYGSE